MDFKTFKLTRKPNQFLIAPEAHCQNAKPHATPKIFSVDPQTLEDAFADVALAEPRVTRKPADDGQREFVQRSALMRFPDTITFEAIDLGDGTSTFAIYSRSKIGHSDLGVNRKRIESWLKKLDAAL
ncbi:MAG: hypothetical protein CMI60_23920 [Parvibaculum sp.]|jgi:uncharacterized protein (DUF1499 family)|nr:hypothetical protein [Parvibaculum sp.]|tara:strand:- start:890 stop:1270 length:381 start_codon:yes stop_codon:yes gene_type:complete